MGAHSRLSWGFVLLLNWRIIASQCCVNLCCTTKWIIYIYVCVFIYIKYIPSLLSLLPSLPRPTPLDHHRALSWASCAVLHVVVYICQCYCLSSSYLLLPLLRLQVLSLNLCPYALEIGSSVMGFRSLLEPQLCTFRASQVTLHFSGKILTSQWRLRIMYWPPKMYSNASLCAQLWPALCKLLECSLPGFSVCGISQARILEWVAILLQRISPTQGLDPRLLHWQVDSLPLSHLTSPIDTYSSSYLWSAPKNDGSPNAWVGSDSVQVPRTLRTNVSPTTNSAYGWFAWGQIPKIIQTESVKQEIHWIGMSQN